MISTNKGIVLRAACAFFLGVFALSTTNVALFGSEPLLLVYPKSPTIFRYDPTQYEELLPGHPAYDPNCSVGGSMLWDKRENRIPQEVYRAPNLIGFEVSPFGVNEFFTMANWFNLIVDGFGTSPRQLNNLYVRFIPDPPHSRVQIYFSGQDLTELIHPIPGLDVKTPIEDGFFADTAEHYISWSGSVGMRITVYGDKDGDRVYGDGLPRFSVYVVDNTVPVEQKTWGGIKALFDTN